MCHEYYEARWRKSESPARKTEDAKPDVIATPIAKQEERAAPVREKRVEEKELVPAE